MGSRSKRALLLLMAVSLVVPQMMTPMVAGATAAAPRLGVEFVVAQQPGPQNQVDVLGDTIVWRDGRLGTCDYRSDEEWDLGGDWDIYGFDALNMVEGRLVGAQNAQNHPELGGDYLVWTDRRAAGPRDDDDSDMNNIWMRNMLTGVEKQVTDDDVEQCRPNTDGKTIVWVDSRNYYDNYGSGYQYDDLYMYDMATGKESVVSTGTSHQRRPIVEGDYVVWRDWRNVGTGYTDLHMKNIRTGIESVIVTQGDVYGHQFDGHSVFWYDTSSSPYSIKRYDIGTGATSVVATSTSYFNGMDADGEWVVYQKDVGNDTDDDVYATNIITGIETTVAAKPDCQGNPAIDGGLVAWNDNRDPDSEYPDIYGMYLDWEAGVEQPLSGANRYGTAVLASRKAFPFGADNVVIATASNWPDALGGGVLAAVLDAPVLLTSSNGLPAETAAELERLNVKNAYVIGSTAAVSSVAFEQISACVEGKTTRIGGANRFETSEKVAAMIAELQGEDFAGKAFFATGSNFPDALAGAPVAGALGAPILLADGDSLRASTIASMKAIGVKEGIVLGSTDAVPNSVKAKIESVTAASAVRLGGTNRYATAVQVANYGIASGMTWLKPAMATGANFPDALSAGPMQARIGCPLLLTSGTTLSGEAAAVIKTHKAEIEQVAFVGSTKVINTAVRASVANLLK